MPILEKRYPKIFKELNFNDTASGPLLVKKVFEKGKISQSPDDGRGLGLKRSGDIAADFNATISIREDTFELRLIYDKGKLDSSSYRLDLPKIMGCHICFDFILARS